MSDRADPQLAMPTDWEGLQAHCAELNSAIEYHLILLNTMLSTSINRQPPFSWEALRRDVPKDIQSSGLGEATELVAPSFASPQKPGLLARLIPGATAKFEKQQERARTMFAALSVQYKDAVIQRERAEFERASKISAYEKSVDQFRHECAQGNSEAVELLARHIMARSELLAGFEYNCDFKFLTNSRLLIVKNQFPTPDDVVPEYLAYKAIKSRHTLEPILRKPKSRKDIYTSAISQFTLKIVSEIFRSDRDESIDCIALSGHVNDIDKATGQPINPCILSLRITREQYRNLDLRNVDPAICLRSLRAEVSRSPDELIPVRPIVEYDMNDPRFIDNMDVLREIDSRTNLMTLTPQQFEGLISNLFEKMGLDTKLTRPSRDGGVDCVAYDARPILGGKVVIQAKRYKNTVGVNAVRDLFGTMINEGANKGILVTTSGFGSAAFDFANGKPIELISGEQLLYLLNEHAQVEAKIEMPTNWSDPPESH